LARQQQLSGVASREASDGIVDLLLREQTARERRVA